MICLWLDLLKLVDTDEMQIKLLAVIFHCHLPHQKTENIGLLNDVDLMILGRSISFITL